MLCSRYKMDVTSAADFVADFAADFSADFPDDFQDDFQDDFLDDFFNGDSPRKCNNSAFKKSSKKSS